MRTTGMTYRAIAVEVGYSATYVERLTQAAFNEYAQHSQQVTGSVLGEELARLDSIVRSNSAIMLSSRTSPAEKIRAGEAIRKAGETRMRYLGVTPTNPADQPSRDGRAAYHDQEVAQMSDDVLERELAAFGWRKDDDTGPSPGADTPPALQEAP